MICNREENSERARVSRGLGKGKNFTSNACKTSAKATGMAGVPTRQRVMSTVMREGRQRAKQPDDISEGGPTPSTFGCCRLIDQAGATRLF